MFISVASWKLGLFYYFCKLLSFVAIAFPSMFPGETSAASLRRLCKSSALACWANCFCYKFNIVNSWHNSNLVIVDWSRGKQVHLVFRVGLPKSRWFIILCYVKEDMLAHNDISGHFQFSILFQNILILSMKIVRLQFVQMLWHLTANICRRFCFWKGYSPLKVEFI